jgi:hypothetical protein
MNRDRRGEPSPVPICYSRQSLYRWHDIAYLRARQAIKRARQEAIQAIAERPKCARLEMAMTGSLQATMLKKVVLAVGLIAIPSVAPAQQQPEQQQPEQQQPPQQLCQLECTFEKSERVTRNCHALNAGDCANLGRAETGVGRTCRGYITSNCVQGR